MKVMTKVERCLVKKLKCIDGIYSMHVPHTNVLVGLISRNKHIETIGEKIQYTRHLRSYDYLSSTFLCAI